MDRNTIDWAGPMPAITTPFCKDGSLDEEALAANIDRLMRLGATGIVAGGCTGEFWSLTLAERAALAAHAVRAVAGRGPVLLGAAAIRAAEVVELSHAAAEAGADGVLVTPPFFVQLTRAEIVAHFAAVDAGSALPVMLYNIPVNAGNAITPEIASELADLPRVVAIKESSGDWNSFHATLAACRDRIRVFCGPSSMFGVPAVLAGCDGLIDCFPNVWAGCLDLWHATRAGDLNRAWALQETGRALTALFVSGGRTLYPATKAAMDHLGLPGGGAPRPPLMPLSGGPLRELIAGLARLVPRGEAS
ncbi:MAG: dihydrodipicolinate synthase family protein [Alphaproteobacteria bacterium]|nr:MAG: dihydrodipicolinate synthase family protein [Alphaproteobacteria bacterium]